MAQLPEVRQNIFEEEVSYTRPVSEFTFNKMGSSINFINERQYLTHSFLLNGNYARGAGSEGLDGIFVALFDIQLIGISIFNWDSGTAGTTFFDIHKLDSSGTDLGSIFLTTPSITWGNDNEFGTALYDSSATLVTESKTSANVTNGSVGVGPNVLNQLDFGEAYRFDLPSAQSGASNCGIYIHYRPR